jgi:hypothetical protein
MFKRYDQRRVVSVERQVAQGTSRAVVAVLTATGRGTGIKTIYLERLNATCRTFLAPWYAWYCSSCTPKQ